MKCFRAAAALKSVAIQWLIFSAAFAIDVTRPLQLFEAICEGLMKGAFPALRIL